MFKKKTEKSNFNETVHEEHILILGVGMPKCGTTAIENYLLRSNDYLMENGYEYPNLEYELVARDMEVPPCKGIYDNGNGGVFIQYYRKNQPAPRDHIYENLWEIIKEKLKYRNVILPAILLNFLNPCLIRDHLSLPVPGLSTDNDPSKRPSFVAVRITKRLKQRLNAGECVECI
mgnify:CR=1 FL=1